MNKYQSMKQELKYRAKQIREIKAELKEAHRNWQHSKAAELEYKKAKAKREFRYRHIACSLFRGKALSQIENPWKKGSPDLVYINNLVKQFEAERKEEEEQYEQAVCLGS